MKLTKQEYQNLIDSRFVDLEDAVKDYKDQVAIVPDGKEEFLVECIINCAERLKEAHKALLEAEEQVQIDEAEEEYKKQFGGK